MPLVYADTSALFAYLHPRDEFAFLVTEAARRESPDFICWCFLRFELRHNLRQARGDSYGGIAWDALRAAERTQSRLRWQKDLTCEEVLELAEELSQDHAPKCAAGSADFLHVAAARKVKNRLGLDEFWTCDGAQGDTSRRVGLKTRVFELRESARLTGR